MESGARARGFASWARGRALGDGVSGRWVAAAKVPSAYTRTLANSGRASCGGRLLEPPLRIPAKLMRDGARCAILIGSRQLLEIGAND